MGAMNDNVFKNALLIVIAYNALTWGGLDSKSLIAFASGIFILPFFLFSHVAGQLADNIQKSKIAVAVKASEVAIMIIAAVGFWFQNLEILMIALFLMGAHSTFFGPMKYSAIPEVTAPEHLIRNNAAIEAGTLIAILAGTVLAGLLVSIQASGIAAGLTATGIAILGLLAALKMQTATPETNLKKLNWNFFEFLSETKPLVRNSKNLKLCLWGVSFFWLFGTVIFSVLPNLTKDVLFGDESVLTCLLAIFTFGIGVGSFLAHRISPKEVDTGFLPLCLLGMSACLGFFGYSLQNSFPAGDTTNTLISLKLFLTQSIGIKATISFFVLSVLAGAFSVPLYTMMQTETQSHQRSKVIALNNIYNALSMVAASLSLMALYHFGFTIVDVFWILTVLCFTISFVFYLSTSHAVLRFYCQFIASAFFDFKVVDKRSVPSSSSTGTLIICNHITLIDWMFIGASIKKPTRFVITIDYFDRPHFRWLLKQGNVIPIATRKESEARMAEALDEIVNSLKFGDTVCLFPEGGLTTTGEVRPFMPGVTGLIRRCHSLGIYPNVQPMALRGLWGSIFSKKPGADVSDSDKPKSWRRSVTLKIGETIATDPNSNNQEVYLESKKLRQIIQDLFMVSK